MRVFKMYSVLLSIYLIVLSCGSAQSTKEFSSNAAAINTLTYLDELIIPNDTAFDNLQVGGISGIDYKEGIWYLLSDDRAQPRFYKAILDISSLSFKNFAIREVVYLKDTTGVLFSNGQADPESIRITPNNKIIWSSEGDIAKKIDPFIRIASLDGMYEEKVILSKRYLNQPSSDLGPRNNGVFESLSVSNNLDGYWTLTELPLKEDGTTPTSSGATSPLRLAYINKDTRLFEKEFVYELGKVARKGDLEVNGVTEILAYDTTSLLVSGAVLRLWL